MKVVETAVVRAIQKILLQVSETRLGGGPASNGGQEQRLSKTSFDWYRRLNHISITTLLYNSLQHVMHNSFVTPVEMTRLRISQQVQVVGMIGLRS